MALPLEELEAATRKHFMPVITNQIFKVSPVLHRIFKIAQEGKWGLALPSYDGQSIVEPLEYGEVSGGSGEHGAYAKADTWSAGSAEVLSGANFPWKMYHVSLKIHNMDTEANKGRERLFDLAAVKLRNSVQTLRKDLITDFYLASDDDTAKKMIGIRAMVAADKKVGAINQAEYDWWEGNINTAEGNRDITWLLLNKMFFKTKKYGAGDRASLIVASEGVMQSYEDSLTKVASNTPSPLVQLAQLATKGMRQFDGGFEGFSFKQIPMISDPYAPANKLFFLNERYIHWRVLKNFEATGWTQLRSQGKDWAQNTIFGYGALTSACNRKLGMIEALNES